LSDDHSYEDLVAQHVSLRRILRLFRPHWPVVVALLSLLALGAVIEIASPFLLRAIIDEALPERNMLLLAVLTGGSVAVAAVASVLHVFQIELSARTGQAVMHDLRSRLYGHLQSLSLSFFTSHRSGEIQSRIANDIGGLQAVVTNTATDLIRSIGVLATTAIAMLALDWRLALLSFAAIPPTTWIAHRVSALREKIAYQRQMRLADLSSMAMEFLSVSGIILARTSGRRKALAERFAATSGDVARLEVEAMTRGHWLWSLVFFVPAILPASTLMLGGALMHQVNPVTIGTLVALIALQEQLLWPFVELLESGQQLRSARALMTRVFEYFDTQPDILEPKRPATIERSHMAGAIRIANVSFAYDKAVPPALTNVSIDIPAGTHLGIVGATGSGKTTLGYLLARLYDVDSGSIQLDGMDVRDMTGEQLAGILGVVPQEPFLLHTTIAENIRFGRPEASDADVRVAAEAAQIAGLIATLPSGYDTLVGERGYRLSGGEKQRLALARVLLRDPAILLLDEATSALDVQTEEAIVAALARSRGRTIVTIAHRISTVRDADQIVVLDRGRLVERGTHDELLGRRGRYAALVRS